MTVLNRTVFDIPLTWNRTRFEATRRKCRFARKLIESSINVQFEKQMKGVFSHNIDIDENVSDINDHLCKYHDKLRVLDNMIELASQSLRTYFDKRMETIRSIVQEHCNVVQQIIHEEAEHWKEIHAVMDQNLLNPGDIRSRNNYPRAVQKSPASYINTIEEEEDEAEEHLSKLVNGKTLTPLLTQMIRKSRLQSKRLTIIPSTKMNIPIIHQERSLPRKEEQFSMHILPLSVTRQPLEIVDTTFVVKPEETILDVDHDEPNGTYRAPNQHCRSHLRVPHVETSMIDSQPNLPPRLCFSPTILQDGTIFSENEIDEQSMQTLLLPIDHNRTHVKRTIDDNRRFGQTFLLDIIKMEQNGDTPNDYIRPAIPDDDDEVVVVDINVPLPPTKQLSHTRNDTSVPKPDPPLQQESMTIQETVVVVKSRTRATTKTKCKPVIVSARKTRSAVKILAEQAVAAATKPLVEKSTENKRKTRKRKQSKSINPPVETSDDEQERVHPTAIRSNDNRRKTKRRKKSKADNRSAESSDDDDNTQFSTDRQQTIRKRSKSKRNDQQQEVSNDHKKRKTKKSKERDVSDNENGLRTNFTKRKKTKVSTTENEEKKRKQKNKNVKNDDTPDEQISNRHRTGSSGKRNVRSS